jgi:hypothetical protein
MPRVEPGSFFAGVRSPPLRGGGKPSPDDLAEESPKTMREAVFSEGCALRVRKYGSDANRVMSWLPEVGEKQVA